MKLNDLYDKEIVSMVSGERLGDIFDIEFDESTGRIQNIVIKSKFSIFNIFSSRKYITLSWNCVKVIGEEIVLVEENYSNQTLFT